MTFLVDTNVVAELRRRTPNPGVHRWWESTPTDRIHLSVITLGEVRNGIERLRPAQPDSAAALELWTDGLVQTFRGRIESIDTEVAETWGRLLSTGRRDSADYLLAATALVHGWTLVTRNVRDVEQTGCLVLNPFS